MRCAALALMTFAAACDSDPVAPGGGPEGIHFRDGAGAEWAAAGTPSTSGDLLDAPFAVARADPVGGIVLIGFDPQGDVGDLFVLQAPRTVGTHACAEFGESCHGRFITGVTIESTATFDRFHSVVSGSLTLTQIGPDRMRGSFDLKLVDGSSPGDTLVVNGGVVDVPFVGDEVTNGALGCLLSLVGIGTGSCSS
jgi:hypothetical protein